MLSEFRLRKLRHEFRSNDFDRSGYLEFSDYEGTMQELCRVQGISLDSEAYRSRFALLKTFWEQLEQFGDSNKDGKVSEEEFCTFFESLFASGGSPTLDNTPAWLAGLTDAYFEILDADGNGDIGLSEYTTYCSVRHIPAAVAAEAFSKLDLNGDGGLSKEEVRQLVLDFYFSDNLDAPGNNLYGPLN